MFSETVGNPCGSGNSGTACTGTLEQCSDATTGYCKCEANYINPGSGTCVANSKFM